jgi:type I restriction enzyme, S subunit
MEKVKFKDLFAFSKKTNLNASENVDDGKYPFYTSSSIISKRTNNPIYHNKSLVFGNGGSANIHYADMPFSATSHCYIATPKSEAVNIKYVYYFFYSDLNILERGFKGAGLKNISSKYIDEIDIPLPDLETQNKIVAILDKAKSLIEKREKTIAKYDELLRATFLDMFGDPVKNEKGWAILPFIKVGKFISGGTPDKSNTQFWQGNFPWVSPKDMKVSFIKDSQDHISELVFKETSLKRIEPNHLLIVVRGMILAHSFPIAINTIPVAINQDMKAIKPIEELDVRYLQECLNSLKRQILDLVSTAGHGTKKFDSEAIEKLHIPIPPLEIQNKFSTISTFIYSFKEKLNKSKIHLENLFNALSQSAFKDELEFNTAVDLEVLMENDYEFLKKHSTPESIQLLLDRLDKNELNDKKYYEQAEYEKAKEFVFKLLKEGKIEQTYESNSVKLRINETA